MKDNDSGTFRGRGLPLSGALEVDLGDFDEGEVRLIRIGNVGGEKVAAQRLRRGWRDSEGGRMDCIRRGPRCVGSRSRARDCGRRPAAASRIRRMLV